MDIAPFKVEEWMNEYETGARYNIAETCVDSLSLDQLFALAGEDKTAFWEAFCARRMTYGDIEGAPAFKQGVAGLFRTVQPRDIVTTHGAAGANHHVFYSLVRPGDHVISVAPTYQQLYAIPAGFGARVELLHLRREDGFLPDLERLRQMVRPDTRLICLNNPNNPTGALMDGAMLREIVDIARSIGAYVLCDEVYRFLTQEDGWSESIADLYEKGISVGSMSKVFSLAGLRQGWIVCRDQAFIRACLSHRDYDLVSCSQFDEAISALALAHKDKLLARSRTIVRENLAVLDAWVENEPRVHYVKPSAGTTALVYYDADLPSYEFCRHMYHATGAFVTPGACFEEEHCVRIGYAYGRQALRDGLAAFSAFLDQLAAEG